eukprot:3600986-Pyramimonas_sp.AAC.1
MEAASGEPASPGEGGAGVVGPSSLPAASLGLAPERESVVPRLPQHADGPAQPAPRSAAPAE